MFDDKIYPSTDKKIVPTLSKIEERILNLKKVVYELLDRSETVASTLTGYTPTNKMKTEKVDVVNNRNGLIYTINDDIDSIIIICQQINWAIDNINNHTT